MTHEKRIGSAVVRKLCGDVSDMWLYRRLNDSTTDFPRPVFIAGRRYWKQAEILAWLESRPTANDGLHGAAAKKTAA